MRVFLDTNILAYQFDGRDPHKQARARELVMAGTLDRRISTQVLLELHAVLTRKLGHDRARAEEVLRAVDFPTVRADRSLVLAAAATAAADQLSVFDALIVEAAARAGCDELWTEDLTHGQTLRGVRVVNPFLVDG